MSATPPENTEADESLDAQIARAQNDVSDALNAEAEGNARAYLARLLEEKARGPHAAKNGSVEGGRSPQTVSAEKPLEVQIAETRDLGDSELHPEAQGYYRNELQRLLDEKRAREQ